MSEDDNIPTELPPDTTEADLEQGPGEDPGKPITRKPDLTSGDQS